MRVICKETCQDLGLHGCSFARYLGCFSQIYRADRAFYGDTMLVPSGGHKLSNINMSLSLPLKRKTISLEFRRIESNNSSGTTSVKLIAKP